MRRLLVAATLAAAVTFAVSSPVFAAGDPTVDQVYTAARTGHLDQAQQMITQVLTDHPNSSQAHYIQAELYAREGKAALARTELARAGCNRYGPWSRRTQPSDARGAGLGRRVRGPPDNAPRSFRLRARSRAE